jgi:multidrug efflux pump subunit AcrA (membrane-fusion protein)
MRRPLKFKVAYIFIIIFVIIYVPIMIKFLFNENVDMSNIRQGIVEDSAYSECLIFRDESVLSSDQGGRYVYNAEEGKRVAKGQTVAYVYGSSTTDNNSAIIKLNEQIRTETEKIIEQSSIPPDISAQFDTDISTQLAKVSDNAFEGTFRYSDTERRSIDKLISTRNDGIIAASKDTTLTNLKTQLKSIEDAQTANSKSVVANETGIASYEIDGFEGQLNIDKASTISMEQFNSIINSESSNSVQNDVVAAGQPFVKIIYNDYILLGSYVDVKYKDILNNNLNATNQSNNSIDIRADGTGDTIAAKVVSVSNEIDGKVYTVLKTYSLTTATAAIRTVGIQIVFDSASGYKVPIASLTDYKKYGNTARLAVVKSNKVVFVKVDCICEDGTFSAVQQSKDDTSGVKLMTYDKYVINPDKVKEGQVVS